MNKALLDTDIYSEILKAINPTVAQNAMAYRQAQGFLTFSTITVMEVIQGFQRNQSFRRLQAFLTAAAQEEILPFDQPAAGSRKGVRAGKGSGAESSGWPG